MALPLYNVEGPWGGDSGSSWTDGTYSSIKSITVTHKDLINAIEVTYSLKGESRNHLISAPQHGGGGGNPGNATTFTLDEDEYLTKIEGYVGRSAASDNFTVVTSLTFTTNRNTYGPYGTAFGDYFKSSENGKIVGFYGRAGWYLVQLGIYTLKA